MIIAISLVLIVVSTFYFLFGRWSIPALDESRWTSKHGVIAEMHCEHIFRKYHQITIRLGDEEYERRWLGDRPGCEYVKENVAVGVSLIKLSQYNNWIYRMETDNMVIFNEKVDIVAVLYIRFGLIFLSSFAIFHLVMRYLFTKQYIVIGKMLNKALKKTFM